MGRGYDSSMSSVRHTLLVAAATATAVGCLPIEGDLDDYSRNWGQGSVNAGVDTGTGTLQQDPPPSSTSSSNTDNGTPPNDDTSTPGTDNSGELPLVNPDEPGSSGGTGGSANG